MPIAIKKDSIDRSSHCMLPYLRFVFFKKGKILWNPPLIHHKLQLFGITQYFY